MSPEELLNIKLNAFTDEDDKKILDLLKEIGEKSNNFESANTYKDIEAVPEMLSTISEFVSDKNNLANMPIRDTASFILAMKEFSAKLKPLYIKVLLYKEMKKND